MVVTVAGYPDAMSAEQGSVVSRRMPPGEARTVDFGGVEIEWDPRVLEPRPWTVAQAEWAAELADEAPEGPLLELCCGAGQIGLLAARLSGRGLVQVDRDELAASYARRNAERAGIASEVRVAGMDHALAPGEAFPVIIADPPWLPTGLVSAFPDDPITAVDGGVDGMALVIGAARVGLDHLAREGHLVLQVGSDDQADALAAYLDEERLGAVEPRLVDRRRCTGGVLVHLKRRG